MITLKASFLQRFVGLSGCQHSHERRGFGDVLQHSRSEGGSDTNTILISGTSLGKGPKSHLISCEQQQDTDTPSGARALPQHPALAIPAAPDTSSLSFELRTTEGDKGRSAQSPQHFLFMCRRHLL